MEEHVIYCENTLNSKKFWLYIWRMLRFAQENFHCKISNKPQHDYGYEDDEGDE